MPTLPTNKTNRQDQRRDDLESIGTPLPVPTRTPTHPDINIRIAKPPNAKALLTQTLKALTLQGCPAGEIRAIKEHCETLNDPAIISYLRKIVTIIE
jgi:hypothetical protein